MLSPSGRRLLLGFLEAKTFLQRAPPRLRNHSPRSWRPFKSTVSSFTLVDTGRPTLRRCWERSRIGFSDNYSWSVIFHLHGSLPAINFVNSLGNVKKVLYVGFRDGPPLFTQTLPMVYKRAVRSTTIRGREGFRPIAGVDAQPRHFLISSWSRSSGFERLGLLPIQNLAADICGRSGTRTPFLFFECIRIPCHPGI